MKKELLTTNLFIKIFQKIKKPDTEIRKTPGTKLTDGRGEVICSHPEGERCKAEERYLKELVRLKILEYEKVGEEVIYKNVELHKILTAKPRFKLNHI